MRLVCLHTDTVDALKRLRIEFEDLTPSGLWSSQYHLVGLTPDQFEALELFRVEAEDVTPAPLMQAVRERAGERPRAAAGDVAAGGARPTAERIATPAPGADASGREPAAAGAAGGESEVPLAQGRDTSTREAEAKAGPRGEAKPNGRATQTPAQNPGAQPGARQEPPQRVGGKGEAQQAAPAQSGRKGQPPQGQAAEQRYGTTRLRISVAGKYTEATVANGKIVIGSRTFDTPDQAAAELTKSRGDWTFWEYYDSGDGKWRMLTRDWDSVLKSAAPGGR